MIKSMGNNKVLKMLLVLVSLLLLSLSAFFGVLIGVSIFEEKYTNYIRGFTVVYFIVSLIGATVLSKLNEKMSITYSLFVFPIAGLCGGMTRFFSRHDDGALILMISGVFFVFFLIGTKYLKKGKLGQALIKKTIL